MCYTSALRKGGLPIIRNFLHSLQGINHALPTQVQQRNKIQFRLKKFHDGKIIFNELVNNDLVEAFEAKVIQRQCRAIKNDKQIDSISQLYNN